MADNSKIYQVGFNAEQKKLYDDLVAKGLVKRSWSEFVKDAFYDKVESIDVARAMTQKFEEMTRKTADSQTP